MQTLTMQEIEEVSGASALCRALFIGGGGIVGAFGGGVGIGAGLLAGEITGAWICAD